MEYEHDRENTEEYVDTPRLTLQELVTTELILEWKEKRKPWLEPQESRSYVEGTLGLEGL